MSLRVTQTAPIFRSFDEVKAREFYVSWLGFTWDNLHFASNYFDQLNELAVELIHKGLAYVDSLSPEQIAEYRGNFTTPGKPSPHRERTVEENLALSVPIFERMAKIGQIIEIEAGVVGGEEDGAAGSEDTPDADLYTTPEDMVRVYEAMGKVDGTYMFAATFGNVHGAYKPGAVKLRPKLLKEGQDAIKAKFGQDAKFYLVFHGGSGSEKHEIHETLDYGVIKMNVDTDCQYAFTRPVADHMLKNYDQVMKIDGEVGSKKFYDPRAYLKAAETAMADRVKEACEDLKAVGKSLAAEAAC